MSTKAEHGEGANKLSSKRKADQPENEQRNDARDSKQARVEPTIVEPISKEIKDKTSLETIPKVKAASESDKDQSTDVSKNQEAEAAKQRAKDRNWKRKQKKKVKMDGWKQAAGIQ